MPVKKIVSLIFLTLTIAVAFSQEKIAAYSHPSFKKNESKVFLFKENEGNHIADISTDAADIRLSMKEGEGFKLIYTDSVITNSVSKKSNKDIRSLKRLGTVRQNNLLNDCYYSERLRTVYLTETKLDSGIISVTDTIGFDKKEYLVAVLEDSGKLYIVSYLDKSDILYIRVKRPGYKLRGFEKTIEINTGKESKKTPHFSDFFKVKESGGYFIYDITHPYPAYLSEVKEKIYHFPGRIIFSLENFNQQTNLVSLSLVDFKHQYYTVPPPFLYAADEDIKERTTCSFLESNILFKTGSYKDLFFMTATDIYSGVAYYSNTIKLNRKQDIANTPFFKNAKFDEKAKKVQEKLHLYLESPSVSVHYAGGQRYDIEVSSSYKGVTWQSVALSLVASFAGTYAINSIPDTWGYCVIVFYSQKVMSIKNTLDLKTGIFTADKDNSLFSTDKWENKLQMTAAFIKENEEADPATLIAGENIYVYFIDKTEGKLLVYKF
jgi:hypothetical protein